MNFKRRIGTPLIAGFLDGVNIWLHFIFRMKRWPTKYLFNIIRADLKHVWKIWYEELQLFFLSMIIWCIFWKRFRVEFFSFAIAIVR